MESRDPRPPSSAWHLLLVLALMPITIAAGSWRWWAVSTLGFAVVGGLVWRERRRR